MLTQQSIYQYTLSQTFISLNFFIDHFSLINRCTIGGTSRATLEISTRWLNITIYYIYYMLLTLLNESMTTACPIAYYLILIHLLCSGLSGLFFCYYYYYYCYYYYYYCYYYYFFTIIIIVNIIIIIAYSVGGKTRQRCWLQITNRNTAHYFR